MRKKLDADRTTQFVSPRRTQYWAKSYKDRAARLETEGRMRPPGRASIETGKQNGLWSFMDDVEALIVPDDLRTALAEVIEASENYDGMAPSYRRNTLRWLKLAKTEPTRKKRVAKIVAFAARKEKIPNL